MDNVMPIWEDLPYAVEPVLFRLPPVVEPSK
jgi:hypothetical protein